MSNVYNILSKSIKNTKNEVVELIFPIGAIYITTEIISGSSDYKKFGLYWKLIKEETNNKIQEGKIYTYIRVSSKEEAL